jgi:hypothetical protein
MPEEVGRPRAARAGLTVAFIILAGMVLWVLSMAILGPNYRPVP